MDKETAKEMERVTRETFEALIRAAYRQGTHQGEYRFLGNTHMMSYMYDLASEFISAYEEEYEYKRGARG